MIGFELLNFLRGTVFPALECFIAPVTRLCDMLVDHVRGYIVLNFLDQGFLQILVLKQIFEVHKVASVVRGGSVNKTLVFPRIRWYTVTFLNLAVGRLNPRNHWSTL